MTSRLYGGDGRVRVHQELLLGVGGLRALRALGITLGLHLNEGHSGLPSSKPFDNAWMTKASASIRPCAGCPRSGFHTHTPVPAGHDRFDADLVEEHLGPLREALGLSKHAFMALDAKIPTVMNASA